MPMIIINFAFMIYDDNDIYTHVGIPPYMWDSLADMRHFSRQETEAFLNQHLSFSFECEDTFTVEDVADTINSQLGIDKNFVSSGEGIIHVELNHNAVRVNDYSQTVSTVSQLLSPDKKATALNFWYAFSDSQGQVWPSKDGIYYYMNSRERGSHNMPHVHVNVSHQYDASINILTGKILEGSIPAGKKQRTILKTISEKKEELLYFWNNNTDGLKFNVNYSISD